MVSQKLPSFAVPAWPDRCEGKPRWWKQTRVAGYLSSSSIPLPARKHACVCGASSGDLPGEAFRRLGLNGIGSCDEESFSDLPQFGHGNVVLTIPGQQFSNERGGRFPKCVNGWHAYTSDPAATNTFCDLGRKFLCQHRSL